MISDRITSLLTKELDKPRSPFADTADAITAARPLRILAGQKPISFGEAFNEIQARRLGQEKMLYDVLSNERAAKRADRAFDLQEKQYAAEAERYKAQAARHLRTDVNNFVSSIVNKLNAKDVVTFYHKMSKELGDGDENSPFEVQRQAALRAISGMEISGKEVKAVSDTEDGLVLVYKDGSTELTPYKKKSGETKVVGGKLIDPKTGKVIYSGEPKDKLALEKRALGLEVEDETVRDLTPEQAQNILTMQKGKGISIETTPGGGTRVQIGGGEMGSTLSTEIKGRVQDAKRGIEMIDTLTKSIEDRRGRAGVMGSINAAIQRGVGIAKDVDAALGTNIGQFLNEGAQAVGIDIRAGRADKDVAGFFDPELPEMEYWENVLAYRLARANKGEGRLNAQDVRIWKDQIQLRGLKDVDSVLARLGSIKKSFEAAGSDARELLGEDPVNILPLDKTQLKIGGRYYFTAPDTGKTAIGIWDGEKLVIE